MSTFRIRRELEHQPEQVWGALTRADLLSRWFMQSDSELAPDVRFRLTDPKARGWSGKLDCQVSQFLPNRLLRYTAKEVNGSSVTTLEWTITPTDGGSSLLLEHDGWKGMRGWLTGMALSIGWRSLLKSELRAVLLDQSTHGRR